MHALKRCTSVCSFILNSYYSAVLGEALVLIRTVLWYLNEQNNFTHTMCCRRLIKFFIN